MFSYRSNAVVADTSVKAGQAPVQVDLKSVKSVVVVQTTSTATQDAGIVSKRDVHVGLEGQLPPAPMQVSSPSTPVPGTPQSGVSVNSLFQTLNKKKSLPKTCTPDYCTGKCDAGPFCPGFREGQIR